MDKAAPPSLAIRTASRRDLPAIVDLLADDELGSGRERPGLPLAPEYEEAFAEMSRQRGNDLLVAEAGNEVVGCLQLTIIPGLTRLGAKRAQVEGVRVSAACRGAGIGEALLREAVRRARESGCSLVQLTTDRSRADAHLFYERLGFVASHVGMKLKIEPQ